MKTNRIVLWSVVGIAGFAAMLLLLKAMTLSGHTNNFVYIQHGPGMRGHSSFLVMREVEHHQPLAWLASVWVALKLAVLAAAIWLWSKSSGLLRGMSTVVAGLALMSLLSPIWGALIVIVLLVLAVRGKAPDEGGRLFAGGETMKYVNMSSDTGSFLDEWERNTRK